MFKSRFLSLAAVLSAVAAQVPPGPSPVPPGSTPNKIYEAASIMRKVNSTVNGVLYQISTPDRVDMKVLHVWGSPEEMGKAQGLMLGAFALEFINKALPEFYESELMVIDSKSLPEWLQKLLKKLIDANATKIFQKLLAVVWGAEQSFVALSPLKTEDEIKGMAEGLCASGSEPTCDTAGLTTQIEHLNMLTELVRMTCTIMGAWGSATSSGKLLQLRALDFGSGPFANYTTVTVYHPDDGHPFASVGFPGLAGAVTGFSNSIGLSEKVWETYTGTGIQPGTYHGMPDTLVMREMLQFAGTFDEALVMAEKSARTWAVFLGVGSSEDQQLRILGYREKEVQVFSPDNMTEVTHDPVYADVVYVDKHPQPSHDNRTMPGLMAKYHGELDASVAVSYLPRLMQTGDLHVGVYDYGVHKAWVATGLIDSNGDYIVDGVADAGKACNRPFVEFDMAALWAEPRPAL